MMDVKTPAENVNVKGPALERGAGVECVERVGPVGGGAARFEGGLLLPSLDQPYSTCPKA